MLFAPDGSEVDWHVGYGPPPEKYQEQVEKSLKGVDTFKSLSDQYAKNPKNLEVIFKLAGKQDDLYRTEKAAELYRQVVALDPEGKGGTTDFQGEKVSYAQYAEFNLGSTAASARPPDPAPMTAFIKKYKAGAMVKEAYMRLSRAYYAQAASKGDAAKFYQEYVGLYPQDVPAMTAWVQRILLDKEPVDKGIELALKVIEAQKAAPRPSGAPAEKAVPIVPGAAMVLNLGRLYALKGDKAKALETVDAAAKDIGDNARMVPTIAQAYLDIEAGDKALAIYGPDFAKNNEANATALSGYASFWSRQDKNLESALAAAQKSVSLAGDVPANWLTLGNVYLRMKNAAEAVKAADKALEVAPEAQKAMIQKQVETLKSRAAAIK
jgi:tetratricopeptide (TPR) repeat protein